MYTLEGVDGNAYSVMAYVASAMKAQKFTKEEVDEMIENATSSDYNHLLCVCMDYVEKCNERSNAVKPLSNLEEKIFGELTYELMPLLVKADKATLCSVVCGILDTWMTEHDMDSDYLEHFIVNELMN